MPATKQFAKAFDAMSSGVYIVTSSYRNSPAGCTCVWISRVSFSPPLLAVNLEPTRHTFETVQSGKRFCINILGDDNMELARKFGFNSGHDMKKFDGLPYRRSPGGSPIIESAIGYIDCRLHSIVPAGDHRIVLGELIDAAMLSDKRPMLYDPASFYSDDTERAASHA